MCTCIYNTSLRHLEHSMERTGSDTRAYHSLASSFVWDVPNVDDTQSGLIVYFTGLLPEPPRSIFRVYMGPPQTSHPCIEGCPECQRARGVGTEQKDCRYRSMRGRWLS